MNEQVTELSTMPDATEQRRIDSTTRIAVIVIAIIEAIAMVPLVLHLLGK